MLRTLFFNIAFRELAELAERRGGNGFVFQCCGSGSDPERNQGRKQEKWEIQIKKSNADYCIAMKKKTIINIT